MSGLKKFITTCTLTFKTFDFDVTMSDSKSTLWNFVTTNPKGDKKYCIFCAATISKVKGLIKVALKKLPQGHRLVVVVESHTEEELQDAINKNFTLISLKTLNSYGEEMLTILERESAQAQASKAKEVLIEVNKSDEDFIDKVISKDRLF